MMKRTQLYIQEELHEALSLFAQLQGWSLSRAVRQALKEFVEKPKVKKVVRKKKTEKKNPFMDMAGRIASGDPNMSKNIDEIYDED